MFKKSVEHNIYEMLYLKLVPKVNMINKFGINVSKAGVMFEYQRSDLSCFL